MADTRTTDLTALASADAADVLPIADVSASTLKKITVTNLLADRYEVQPALELNTTVDAFARNQIWFYDTNSILRLGSLAADGDAADVTSEGITIYSGNHQGDPIAAGDWSLGRFKSTRFAITNAKSGVFEGEVFRVDPDKLFIKDVSGTELYRLTTTTALMTLAVDQRFGTGKAIQSNNVDTATLLLQAYDVDNSVYRTFGTLTSGNTPSFALAAPAGGSLTGDFTSLAVASSAVLVASNIGSTVQAYDADTVKSDVATSFTAQQNFGTATLTDGANISWNLNTQQVAKVTLEGNRTLDNPTNMVDGGTYILRVIQDGAGSKTLAYGTAYKFPGGTEPTLSTGAGAVDILSFISDGTNMFGVAQLNFS